MSDQITEARRHLTELQETAVVNWKAAYEIDVARLQAKIKELQETAAHPLQVNHALDDFLNSEVFFDLMQAYRHCPFHAQKEVMIAFEAVKKAIQEVVKG